MSKSKIKTQPKQSSAVPEIKTSGHLLVKIVLVVVTLVIYGQTLNFEFTLDDDLFYLKHRSVQEGLSGITDIFTHGSLNGFDGTTGVQPYRPVTLTVFAFQKYLFDNSPQMAHLINVFLYVLVGLILFRLLLRLFEGNHPWLAGLMTLLYLSHPIHTEVVASVKSMDELLAALFGFLSWTCFITIQKNEHKKRLLIAAGTILFFLALLSKESAIAFMVIIPLSLFMLQSCQLKSVLTISVPLLFVTILFLLIRFNVMGVAPAKSSIPVLDNVLSSAKNFAETTATKAVILFYYLKLMFVPWPLTWDYSYNQIPLTDWTSPTAWLGLLLYGGLFAFAIVNFRRKPLASFLVFFFFITSSPTNNLFFLNGATIGERFLFVPSLSFSILLIWLAATTLKMDIKSLTGNGKLTFIVISTLVLLVFTGLSRSRCSDWSNNLTLFEKGVERSPKSSRAHYSLATEYLNKAKMSDDYNERTDLLQKAIRSFSSSLAILPVNSLAHYNSGICYSMLGDTSNTIDHYRKAISLDSSYLTAVNNLGVIYQAKRNFDSAEVLYQLALRIDPKATLPKKNLADLYIMKGVWLSERGEREKAFESYKVSMTLNDKNVFLLNNIATMYSNMKKYDSALYYLKKGNEYEPENLFIIENIAAVSYLNKNYSQALSFAQLGLSKRPGSKKSLGVLMDTYTALGNLTEAEKFRAQYNNSR